MPNGFEKFNEEEELKQKNKKKRVTNDTHKHRHQKWHIQVTYLSILMQRSLKSLGNMKVLFAFISCNNIYTICVDGWKKKPNRLARYFTETGKVNQNE